MKLISLKKFLILSLFLHATVIGLLSSSFLFVSDSPTYTSVEVTSSISKPTTTPKTFKAVSVSKTKVAVSVKTELNLPDSANSSSVGNSIDLPVPVDGKSVTQGLVPLNLDQINKTIKRTQPATENNVEGIIKLKLLVDETGRVRSVTPLSQLGYGLDEIAAAAAWKLVFKPAQVDSRNVPLETIYSVKFDVTHL